jgi:Raf kinase inhibitor-like YbhB/YbcL family protein
MIMSGPATPDFSLTAATFKEGDTLPAENTCAPTGNPNAAPSPALSWSGAPAAAKAFTLVEQDMDVPPPGGPVVHWIIYNIPAAMTSLPAAVPQADTTSFGAGQGINALRSIGYIGSCPPVGAAPHHYVFQLLATDAALNLKSQPTIVDLNTALQGHVVGQTALHAMFGR